ncbi:MAG: lipase maturation factor family protein [Candidatus Wallbacteria bacterium]|nr:lipase maturation factor family protein [Candidatus Wallbacteria bacterium]
MHPSPLTAGRKRAGRCSLAVVSRAAQLFTRVRGLTCWIEDPAASYTLVRAAFLRALALVYLAAFGSLWTQIIGLVGENGILPAARYLEATRAQLGDGAWSAVPTLFWWGTSDAALSGACAVGAALAIAAVAGLAPGWVFAGLWGLWLSLFNVGQDFLAFQWDLLLLETGFLAIFLAPWRLAPGREERPSLAVIWLLRWLLVRLMLRSGLVKLASGDALWRGLTALSVHYETQPLPTWAGWWAHQLPPGVQMASCAAMFAIELLLPLLMLGPRRARQVACAGTALLMATILVTGNYCYFNWLTLALCLVLLDDRALTRELPAIWLPAPSEEAARPREARWKRTANGAVAALILTLTLGQLGPLVLGGFRPPELLAELGRALRPFCIFNHYGLFAVMTPERPEIEIEGSLDGVSWRAYEFRYKPGDPARPPTFVAPHQPRLDWQMWFAALGDCRENPWFVRFLVRLLEGKAEVRTLLANDPFPEAPPRYLRTSVARYRFTDLATRRRTGAWWKREPKGPYCPVVSLRPAGSSASDM